MSTGTEDDWNFGLLHAPQGAADIVHVRDHEVHVIEPILVRIAEPKRVMQGIRKTTHEGDRVLDPVGGPKVELLDEETLRRFVVRRVQDDMSETRDVRMRRFERRGCFGERAEVLECGTGVRLGETKGVGNSERTLLVLGNVHRTNAELFDMRAYLQYVPPALHLPADAAETRGPFVQHHVVVAPAASQQPFSV